MRTTDTNWCHAVAHPTGESLVYAYDAAGNLLWREIRDAAATVNPVDRADYAYDELNRLIRVTRGADVWEYRYDAPGRRVKLTPADADGMKRGAHHGFADAAADMPEMTEIRVSVPECRRSAMESGEKMEKSRRATEALRPAPVSPDRPAPRPPIHARRLVIRADADSVLTRADEEHKKVWSGRAFVARCVRPWRRKSPTWRTDGSGRTASASGRKAGPSGPGRSGPTAST